MPLLGHRQLPLRDIDRQFRGMDAYAPPDQLREGYYRYAQNVRVRNGEVRTRPGICRILGGADTGLEFPAAFPLSFSQNVDRIVYGAGEYRDPGGVGWSVRVFRAQIIFTRSGWPARFVPYQGTELVEGKVRIIQAFDRLIILRGKQKVPLYWDGDWSGEFVPYPGTNVSNAVDGLYHNSRLWLIYGRDRLQYSDILSEDFAADSDVSVNQGDDSNLVRIYPFNQTTLLLFKERAIWVARNVTGDVAANLTITVINDSRGCLARETVVNVGNDVFFLSEGGVFTVSMVDQSRAQLTDLPISRPIQPIIDRINWRAAAVSRAAYHDNKYYIAVPLDGATRNNAVLVYDLLLQAWISVDTFDHLDDFAVEEWVPVDYLGESVLGAVMPQGYVIAYDYLPQQDENPAFRSESGPQVDIPTRFESRYYTAGTPERKRWLSLRATVRTLHPRVGAALQTEGVGELDEQALPKVERSSQRFASLPPPPPTAFVVPSDDIPILDERDRPVNDSAEEDILADSDAQTVFPITYETPPLADNRYDFWELPYREDYFANFAEGFFLGNGIQLQPLQEWTYPVPCRRTAENLSLILTNDRGRLHINQIEAGAALLPTSRTSV